jgi:hypothetical protein
VSPKILAEMIYISNFCNETKRRNKLIFSTCPNQTKYNKFMSPKILTTKSFQYTKGSEKLAARALQEPMTPGCMKYLAWRTLHE